MRKMNDDIWMILAALSIGVLIWSMAVLGAVLEDLTLLGGIYKILKLFRKSSSIRKKLTYLEWSRNGGSSTVWRDRPPATDEAGQKG